MADACFAGRYLTPVGAVCSFFRLLGNAARAGALVALIAAGLAGSLSLFSAPAAADLGSKVTIASGWAGVEGASDGTNTLVALESDTTTANVAVQLVSASGSKIGSVISLGHSGQACCAAGVAFDGNNYLVTWEEDQGIKNSPSPFLVYGQFISTSGATVGQAFAMTTAGIWFDGTRMLAYGGGAYLLTYTRLIVPAAADASTNRYVAGRIVSKDGTLGNEFRISGGYGNGSTVAFDGTNFFVVWKEDSQDYEVRGRFVSPSGVLGAEISVNASPALSDNPVSAAFDGTNYMVIWTDRNDAATEAHVFGQRVSPAGALVGGVITISSTPGVQMATSVLFDGSNTMALWVDMTNDANGNRVCDAGEGTCWDVYAQTIGKDGALVGGRITINADAGNQMGGGSCTNGTCGVIVSSGVVMGQGGPSQVGDVFGMSLTSTSGGTVLSLNAGWNLLGYSGASPLDLSQFSDTANVTTVWKWNAATSGWAFYAPSLSASALSSYAAGKGYEVLTGINPGEGFWVNAGKQFSLTLPR